MKRSDLALYFFLLLLPGAVPTYAVNQLICRVPGNSTQKPAYIEDVTLVNEPHGGYVEQSIYLKYADHNAFPGSDKVEIIHRFELPQGTVVNDLWLWIGDSVMKALVLDTWTARHIYDSTVAMKRDPAFLSQIGNQYELHVYPLVSGSFRRIKISFITPTKWFGADALCELPLKFLKATAGTTLPVTMLFRSKMPIWGTPGIKELPGISYWAFYDTLGMSYKKTNIANVIPLNSFNLSFSTTFSEGAFFSNEMVPRDYNYFQYGVLPWQKFNITVLDTTPRKFIAGIDLSGFFPKDYNILLPKLKSVLNSALRPGDFFNIIVAGAGRVVPLSGEVVPYSEAAINSMLNQFESSGFGDTVKMVNKPVLIYSDYSASTIWYWNDIAMYSNPKYYNNIMSARPYFKNAKIVTGYQHGWENVLSSSEAALVIQSLDSLFMRGGRFVTYYDLNRAGKDKLATHYIPSLSVKYKTNSTVHISRNMNGNIGRFFPPSVMHGGGYFFNMTDTSMKAEMVDDLGNPCIVSKRLGNGGLLVVTGIWPFSDDEPMRKLLGVPLLGLNQLTDSMLLKPLLASYKDFYSSNDIERFITFTDADSLITVENTESWVENYLSYYPQKPIFKSVNLVDGSIGSPSVITIEGKEYYGNGYLLNLIAEKTRGAHFESHLNDWTTITQRFIPSIHPFIDSLKITPVLSGTNDTLKQFFEVNYDRSDPGRPLFFLGSTNGIDNINVNIDVKFDGIPEIQHGTSFYTFSIDTNAINRVIWSMVGNENLRHKMIYFSSDTLSIIQTAKKYNLLCDYTGMICLEPNDTIQFMINPFDETTLPVELISFTADTSGGNILLNWVTASEKNNAGFEVWRKEDNGDWSAVGFVDGAGTSTIETRYSFKDIKPNARKISYKLKQIDYNGRAAFSSEVTIYNLLPDKFYLAQNYPNPFNPSTTIKYEVPVEGKVLIKVFDILGQEVRTLVNEIHKPGRFSVRFNAVELPSGVYIYRLEAKGFTSSHKMLLIK